MERKNNEDTGEEDSDIDGDQFEVVDEVEINDDEDNESVQDDRDNKDELGKNHTSRNSQEKDSSTL